LAGAPWTLPAAGAMRNDVVAVAAVVDDVAGLQLRDDRLYGRFGEAAILEFASKVRRRKVTPRQIGDGEGMRALGVAYLFGIELLLTGGATHEPSSNEKGTEPKICPLGFHPFLSLSLSQRS